MGAVGGGIGAFAGTLFGIPPQYGYAGGSMIEDTFVKKKKGGEGEEEGGDGSGEAFSAAIMSLLGNRGGGGMEGGMDGGMGGEDQYMTAINSMIGGMGGGVEQEPKEEMLNVGKNDIYTPPNLLGFPSQGRQGYGAAIQKALAASRGF